MKKYQIIIKDIIADMKKDFGSLDKVRIDKFLLFNKYGM